MSDDLPEAVRAYVKQHTKVYPSGYVVVTTECGYPQFHSDRPGCPEWSAADLVEWTKTARPELWNTETDV